MMDELPLCPERYARINEVSIKIMAAPVVSLLIKVLPPPAPKTDWLPPAPKEAPISAPLPDWRRTMAMRATLTVICKIVRNMVMIGV
jgi:hypothetical protein